MTRVEFQNFKIDTIQKKVFAEFKTTSQRGFSFIDLEVKKTEGLIVPEEYKDISYQLKKLTYENKWRLKEKCLNKEIRDKWELLEFSMMRGKPSVKVLNKVLEKVFEYQLSEIEWGFLDVDSTKELKALIIYHEDRFRKEVYSHYHSIMDSLKNGFWSTLKGVKDRKTLADTYSR